MTETCSDVSDAENRDPWDLSLNWPAFEFLFLPVGVWFCLVLPVGYCEVIFLCMYVFFSCIGYREVSTDLGLTSFPDRHGKSGQRPGNETNLPRIGYL